jgi:hypothetical protein
LGPQFVGEPYIKAALQEKGAFNTRWLPFNGDVDADSFFAKLKNIHDALVELATYQQIGDISSIAKAHVNKYSSQISKWKGKDFPPTHQRSQTIGDWSLQNCWQLSLGKMEKNEGILNVIFGGNAHFKRALGIIKNLDFRKDSMQE